MGSVQVARLRGVPRDAVLAALVMCLEGPAYVLALWIVVWLGAETGLAVLIFGVKESGALWSMFSHMSRTCLLEGIRRSLVRWQWNSRGYLDEVRQVTV